MLIRFPFRSALILLSACLGVAGALCSVDYALGGREKLRRQFQNLGTNLLIVTPQQSRTVAGRARTGTLVQTLVPADARALRLANLAIVRSSPTFARAFLVKAGDLAKNNTPVIGVEPEFFEMKHWPVVKGEEFTTDQDRAAARVVLLGSSIARDLLGDDAVGAHVLINRVPFEVTGVLAERGQGLDAANEDMQAYVPLSTAMHRLANAEYFSSMIFEVNRPDDIDNTGERVRAILRRRHPRLPKLPDDFDVQNQKQLMDTQLTVSERMFSYSRWIALCALTLAGLGTLSISWIAVRERASEIGIRRALGATPADILIQFLFEAMAPALLGCALGLAGARQATPVLAKIAAQPAVFEPRIALIALGVSTGLNALFALLPARAASLCDPISAIRRE